MARPVAAAIDAAGPALQEVARVKGWKRTVERDLQRAVEAASGARSSPVRLEHWPGVGSVDVMFPGQTAIELKWCKSGDTLANCAWDIAKLASALAEDEIEAGLIVAGAPASHWASSASGVELFDAITYEGDERPTVRELVAILVQGRRDSAYQPAPGHLDRPRRQDPDRTRRRAVRAPHGTRPCH